MPDNSPEISELHKRMLFDFVYEEMSDKEIVSKYNISFKELQSIKSGNNWKSAERKMWDEMIAQLFYRRSVSKISA